MQNILKNASDSNRQDNPWILLLLLLAYVVGGLLVFSLIAQLIVLPFFDFNFQKSIEVLSNPYGSEKAWLPLMIIQLVTSLAAFILIPLWFSMFHLQLKRVEFFALPKQMGQPLFMTLVITFCFMIANSVIIEWNQAIDLPEFMSGIETWAQGKEAKLERLTKYLTEFTSFDKFLLGLFVIAVIPAVGEELLFRGLLQNLLNTIFKNPHAAIWLSAILFSAIHIQFYGFIPRMLLGALFGYLYYWSGNLTIAMIGHFINNGLTLVMLYMSQLKIIDFDPTSEETSPPIYIILIFFIIGSFLLYLFRKYYRTQDA